MAGGSPRRTGVPKKGPPGSPSPLRFLWAALLGAGVLGSCGKPPPPPRPPPPPPPALPRPELPPPADLKFPDWSEAEEETFLERPGPPPAEALRWNFGKGERFGYEVTQSISLRMETQSGGKSTELQARDRQRGTFEFIAGKDRTALVFLKFHTEESFRDGVQIPHAQLEKIPASQIDAVAQEDGTAEIKKPAGRSEAAFFFDAFLALGVGERKLSDGWVKTRTAGFAKVGRFDCVRLESEYEFTPSSKERATLQRGRTVAFFALDERRFVRASAQVATSLRTCDQDASGAWSVKRVDSRTFLRAKLLDTP